MQLCADFVFPYYIMKKFVCHDSKKAFVINLRAYLYPNRLYKTSRSAVPVRALAGCMDCPVSAVWAAAEFTLRF